MVDRVSHAIEYIECKTATGIDKSNRKLDCRLRLGFLFITGVSGSGVFTTIASTRAAGFRLNGRLQDKAAVEYKTRMLGQVVLAYFLSENANADVGWVSYFLSGTSMRAQLGFFVFYLGRCVVYTNFSILKASGLIAFLQNLILGFVAPDLVFIL